MNGNCKISCLLFADDLVLLSSAELGLNNRADACNTAATKTSTDKIEVLLLSRNSEQCS